MSGLSLKTAAGYFLQEPFLKWNPATDTFGDQFIGRLQRTDRFRTIYHKPTRRQKLSFQDTTLTMPASGVIQHYQTGYIYLTSTLIEEEYWKGDQYYESLCALHLTQEPSGGKGTYVSVTTSGTGDNLGAVVLTESAPIYYDLELRTVGEEPGTEEIYTGKLIATFSSNVSPSPGDFFLLDSEYYRVNFTYSDGGFSTARVIKEDPAYVMVSYDYGTASNAVYNPATGTFTSATSATRSVSAIPKDRLAVRDPVSNAYTETRTLFIYQRHIGFTPKIDDTLTMEGQKYTVRSIKEDTQEEQWILEVSL